jgi:hypothetical protein
VYVQNNFRVDDTKQQDRIFQAFIEDFELFYLYGLLCFFESLVSLRDVLNKRKAAACKPEASVILLLNWEQESRRYCTFAVKPQPLTKAKIYSLLQKSFRRLTQNA